MSYVNVYSSRINWENEPSITSPINATNLNKMDYALYEMDDTFATWDTTKANQSDLLLCVKSIDYDTETGVFVFTWQNGTTKTIDLNIEKIPVSFSMDANGVITMTTDDGTTYTADVGSLIKTYTFTDSSQIDFTVTTDASGNKTVTASIVAGSITGTDLEPNYLANCQNAANSASGSATAADTSSKDAEAWAVGKRGGVDVPSTDPAYHNNSKYWSEQANPTTLTGLTDTDINNPSNGQGLIYNSTSQKWENGAGGGSIATLSDVNLTSVSEGDALIYDATNSEWDNVSLPGRYAGLFGVTEITSNNADLDTYTTPGNYYKSSTSFPVTNYASEAGDTTEYQLYLTVTTMFAGDISIYQDVIERNTTQAYYSKRRFRRGLYSNGRWIFTGWFVPETVAGAYSQAASQAEIKGGKFSPAVSCSAGDTTATFSNVAYSSSYTYDVYTDDGTGEPIAISKIEVNASNQAVVTFANALENATSVKLHYWT